MYFTYITTNPKKTTLYTGVTNNLKRRISEHRKNKGRRDTFAGRYYCYKLIYFESFKYIMDAIFREKEIKNMSREEKLKLIKVENPNMYSILL
jgi:putative endonuclease